MSWDLPHDIVTKILKMAEPALRLRAQIQVQTLHDRAHLMCLMEGQLKDLATYDRPKHLKEMERMLEIMNVERRQLLQLLRLL